MGKNTTNDMTQGNCMRLLVQFFLPILAGNWFGSYPVFVITSILSALFDLMFVAMQRYNRQRIVRLIKRKSY